MIKFIKLSILALVVAIAGCGGGGGGTAPPTPNPPVVKTAHLSGKATASQGDYFKTASAQQAGRMHAQSTKRGQGFDPQSCSAAYLVLFPNTYHGGSLLNFDSKGTGTPDLFIDTNGDGIADQAIDDNCDGVPDYSLDSNGNVVVIGATVKLKNQDTGAETTTTTGVDGSFTTNIPVGNYHVEVDALASDAATIWNQQNKTITTDSDLGAVALSRNPLIQSVTVDGKTVNNLAVNHYVQVMTRSVTTGDVINLNVNVVDPNNLPLTAAAYVVGNASSLFSIPITADGTVQYTVQASDMVNSQIKVMVEVNNNDGRFGYDSSRDTLVEIYYPVTGGVTPPVLNSLSVNGQVFANPVPTASLHVGTAPMDRGDVTISADSDSNVHYQWIDQSGEHDSDGATITIPATAMDGYYNLHVYVTVSKSNSNGFASEVIIPVNTTDKPAVINNLYINNQPTTDKVYRVGDSLLLQPQVSDPQGRPIQCQFVVLGAATTTQNWGPCSMTYTVQAVDVQTSFQVRVWIRNDDGRIIDGYEQDDGKLFTTLKLSE